MIKALRKRHLQIWVLWAVLIPAGIIAAWMAVPEKVTDQLLQPEPGKALPVLVKSISKENFSVNLRSNQDHSQIQLEWINRKVSVLPSSLLYKTSPSPSEEGALENSELIGRIEAIGVYYFPLQVDSTNNYNFILYDIIKKQIIDSIKFGQ